MPLKSLLTLALLGALAIVAAPAQAVTKNCCVGHYQPGLEHATSPAVAHIRAVKLPRLTDGYAPPYLVAEAVAAELQRAFNERGKQPGKVRVYEARWDGGVWRAATPPARAAAAGTPRAGGLASAAASRWTSRDGRGRPQLSRPESVDSTAIETRPAPQRVFRHGAVGLEPAQ